MRPSPCVAKAELDQPGGKKPSDDDDGDGGSATDDGDDDGATASEGLGQKWDLDLDRGVSGASLSACWRPEWQSSIVLCLASSVIHEASPKLHVTECAFDATRHPSFRTRPPASQLTYSTQLM